MKLVTCIPISTYSKFYGSYRNLTRDLELLYVRPQFKDIVGYFNTVLRRLFFSSK